MSEPHTPIDKNLSAPGRLGARVMLAGIRLYRRSLGGVLGGRCRFVPTCSEYAMIAIAANGPIRGGRLALWRILRCHPLCKGGFDPAPVRQTSPEPSADAPEDSRRDR